MKVKITLTTSVIPTGMFIQWTVQEPSETGEYSFTLERSGGPVGPWDLILRETPSQYAVLDKLDQTPTSGTYTRPNQLTFYDRLYYKVTCRTPSGTILTDIAETGPASPSPRMVGYQRKLVRDFRLSLKFTGTLIAVLKRRTWGVRCSRCYDLRTKQVVRSECNACWGTSFTGGYWAPLLTYGKKSATATSVSLTPEQKSDSNDAQIWLPMFPQLERDDVLVSLKDQRRYRVDRQVQPEIQLSGVHQVVTCQELAHDHVIYRLPVSPDLQPLY